MTVSEFSQGGVHFKCLPVLSVIQDSQYLYCPLLLKVVNHWLSEQNTRCLLFFFFFRYYVSLFVEKEVKLTGYLNIVIKSTVYRESKVC
jgi:hypothetical protein